LSCAGATNTEDGSQANFSMFVRRNVDASDTCHFRPLKLIQSALTLLVTWICTDHTNNAFTANDFAVAANFFHRSRNSHGFLLKLIVTQTFSDQVKFCGPAQKHRGFLPKPIHLLQNLEILFGA
jgi:hypothetical protein